MRILSCIFFISIFSLQHIWAQDKVVDSLKKVLSTETEDSNKVNNFISLEDASGKKNILMKITACYNALVLQEFPQGNYPEALRLSFLELKAREQIGDKEGISSVEFNIANIYYCQHNFI